MILTVTLNPAWDMTYTVDELAPGQSHRVRTIGGHAGGKGVNVSRVLHCLGVDTVATGVLGGTTGAAINEDLRQHAMAACFLPVAADSRRTVTVTDRAGVATVLNEPGPQAGSEVWPAFCEHLQAQLSSCALVVLSGSLPPWAPVEAYRQLVDLVHEAGLRCLLDADGAALAAALPAGPDLIKPNRAELQAATGHSKLRDGAMAALAAGAGRVVVSDGPRGLYGYDLHSAWHAEPPTLRASNPTGAGDAAVAALALGMLTGQDWPTLLKRATAWSAAAVLQSRAGQVDPSVVDAITCEIHIRDLTHVLTPETTC